MANSPATIKKLFIDGYTYNNSRQLSKKGFTVNGQNRKDIAPGLEVDIVLKQDQRTGKLTRGVVKDILTNSSYHPHGIKVRLQNGQIGRVQNVIGASK